jgi:hypothetical protein
VALWAWRVGITGFLGLVGVALPTVACQWGKVGAGSRMTKRWQTGSEEAAEVPSVMRKGCCVRITTPIKLPATGWLFVCRITQRRAGVASFAIGPVGCRLWLGCIHALLLDGPLFGWADANRLAHLGLQDRLDKRDAGHTTGILRFARRWLVARREHIHYIFHSCLRNNLLGCSLI